MFIKFDPDYQDYQSLPSPEKVKRWEKSLIAGDLRSGIRGGYKEGLKGDFEPDCANSLNH